MLVSESLIVTGVEVYLSVGDAFCILVMPTRVSRRRGESGRPGGVGAIETEGKWRTWCRQRERCRTKVKGTMRPNLKDGSEYSGAIGAWEGAGIRLRAVTSWRGLWRRSEAYGIATS